MTMGEALVALPAEDREALKSGLREVAEHLGMIFSAMRAEDASRYIPTHTGNQYD